MAELPQIDSLHPRIIDAQPIKEFPHLLITSLKILISRDMSDTCYVSLRNYNRANKKLSPESEDIFSLDIDDLSTEMDRVPALQQAMNKLVTCIGLLYYENELIKQIEEAEKQQLPTAAFKAQLKTIRQQLGIIAPK